MPQWIYGELAAEFGLSSGYIKVEATPQDLIMYLQTLYLRADDIPCTPRTRVDFHGILLLLGLGGFRCGMVLGLKYRHVQLAVVRDPINRERKRLVATVTVVRNKIKRAGRSKKSKKSAPTTPSSDRVWSI